MNGRFRIVAMMGVLAAGSAFLGGCEYPEDEPVVAEEFKPTAGPDAAPSYAQDGGMRDLSGRNSTLGAAKGAAQSVINSAEQASQNTANEADNLANPKR